MLFVPRHSSQVNNAWEAFTTQLQQFDASLEDQKQQLGVAVTKQLEEFRSLAERIEQGQRGRVFLYLGGPEAQRRSILVPYCLINGHPSAWAIRQRATLQALPLAGRSSSPKADPVATLQWCSARSRLMQWKCRSSKRRVPSCKRCGCAAARA
eukprot:scaffold29552_cov21-Tisochrysis_lutea.AAC.1